MLAKLALDFGPYVVVVTSGPIVGPLFWPGEEEKGQI